MSTNALIGKYENGKVRSIYCHHDGYLEGVGTLLYKHYRDADKLDRLIDLGGISSLGRNIEAPTAVKKYGFSYYLNDKFNALSEEERQILSDEVNAGTIAYHRDREEEKVIDIETNEEYLASTVEFVYLFKNGTWYVKDTYNSDEFKLVRELILELKKKLLDGFKHWGIRVTEKDKKDHLSFYFYDKIDQKEVKLLDVHKKTLNVEDDQWDNANEILNYYKLGSMLYSFGDLVKIYDIK